VAKGARLRVGELCSLAAKGLVAMLDPEKQLFCYRLKQTPQGLIREGISHRYTAMSLLGLHRFEARGGASPVGMESIFEALMADLAWVDNIGDLGLLLWLCAAIAPDRVEGIYSRLAVASALNQYCGTEDRRTMELAWFLTGLSLARLTGEQKLAGLSELAEKTYSLLQPNQGRHGFFGHSGTRRSVASAFRGGIGSFADQVYPIYALSKFGQAFEHRDALQRARKCAEAICRAQGPMGQWWWHYDSTTGRVLQRYPVYSVHQHAMAPMGLFAASRATGCDFEEPIYRGLAWIDGNNEFGTTLRATSSSLVWRCAYRPGKLKMYVRELRDYLMPPEQSASAADLDIKLECRPYELGWLLYAFCGPDCK